MTPIQSVRLIDLFNYEHVHAFDEVAEAFASALNVPIVRTKGEIADQGDRPPCSLVFGAHLTRHCDLADNDVIFQTEQFWHENPWFTQAYIDRLKTHSVWDYSYFNTEKLREVYDIDARFVPIRYMPCMTKFESRPEAEKDIDVLFYGGMTPHRDEVINRLLNAGIEVFRAFNVYGKERDDLIARSKIVLNLHQQEAGIFEVFRCAHLFANRKCVVSEYGADDALDKMYCNCATFTVDLERVLKMLLNDHHGQSFRSTFEDRAFHSFSQKTLAEELGTK